MPIRQETIVIPRRGLRGPTRGTIRGARANVLKKTDAAWLAGLFDGEGCVSLNSKPGRINPNLKITINMSNREVIEKVVEVTGVGKLYVIDYEGGKYRDEMSKTRKNQYRWIAYGGNAVILLRQMLPWLIVKRRKAEIGIKLYPGVK